MQALRFIIFLFLSSTTIFAQPNVQLSGTFSQHAADTVYLQIPTQFIAFEGATHQAPIKDAKFQIDFELEEPALVVLHVGDQRVPLFLHPWDSLHIESGSKDLRQNLVFSGLGKNENEILQTYRSDFLLSPPSVLYPESYRDKDPEDFLKSLNRRDKKVQKWWEEAQRTVSVSEKFAEYLSLRIRYDRAEELLGYANYRSFTRIDPLPSSEFYESLNNVPLSEAKALHVYTYTTFLDAYLGYLGGLDSLNVRYFTVLYDLAGEKLTGKVRAHVQARTLVRAWRMGFWEAVESRYLEYRRQNESPAYSNLLQRVHRLLDAVRTDMPAPNFVLQDVSGDMSSLKGFRGKHVLLTFWRTDCTGCLPDLERIARLSEKYTDAPIAFVFIALDTNKEQWKTFLQKRKLAGVHLWSHGIFSKVSQDYQLDTLPMLFLITPEGKFAPPPGRPLEGLSQSLEEAIK
ncbi:MAG: TlpA disulfide reductase family protein [Bacteroidota bacterium]